MKILSFLGKTAFGFTCAVGFIGFGKALLRVIELQGQHSRDFLTLGAGAFTFFLVWLFYLSRTESFWSVIEHELTHALFALLFFKRVRSLSAHRRHGGMIQVEGGNFMIGLAPYFFPLFTILLILIKPLIQTQYQSFISFLIGFTFMFHLMNLIREFHPRQPDLRENGFLFSSVVVLFFNLFFAGLVVASLPGTWDQLGLFIKQGMFETGSLFKMGLTFISQKFYSPSN